MKKTLPQKIAMAQKEIVQPVQAIKTEQYQSYTVREHERKMYERVYKFVCSGCDLVVERKSYAVCCPSYGNECNGKNSVCRRQK
jgi:hypothetical protein